MSASSLARERSAGVIVEEVSRGDDAIVSRVFYDGGCAPSQTLDAVEAARAA